MDRRPEPTNTCFLTSLQKKIRGTSQSSRSEVKKRSRKMSWRSKKPREGSTRQQLRKEDLSGWVKKARGGLLNSQVQFLPGLTSQCCLNFRHSTYCTAGQSLKRSYDSSGPFQSLSAFFFFP